MEASQPVIENLVKVGALDALGSRGEMLAEIPGLLQFKRRKAGAGWTSHTMRLPRPAALQ